MFTGGVCLLGCASFYRVYGVLGGGSLNSFKQSLLKNEYDIDIVNAPPLHSSSNGQVERFHGTYADIARAIKVEKMSDYTSELILKATIAHN